MSEEKLKQLTRFRGRRSAEIIWVCEGSGTQEDPQRLVWYVYSEGGDLLGIIDPQGLITSVDMDREIRE